MSAARLAERAFLAVAIVMTLGLLGASLVPAAGEAIRYGALHYLAHLAAFAVLAFAWRRGLPRAPAWVMLLAVAAFGFVQEWIEIAGHAHPFELPDALVDAVGAVIGVALERAMQELNAGMEK